MMNRKICHTLVLLSLLAAGSCIKDEHLLPCPPLKVSIEVKDKNYFNVRHVASEQILAEDLPFRRYVPTLYFRLQLLHDDGTATLMTEHELAEVQGDAPTQEFTFPDEYPHGTYVMTTWGGLKDLSPLDDKRTTITFHPAHTAGEDIYFSQDTLLYDPYRHDYTVALERTKGKLVVEYKKMPAAIHRSTTELGDVAQQMDASFSYRGLTHLFEAFDWEHTGDEVTALVTAPSLTEKGTLVKSRLYDVPDNGTAAFTPPAAALTVSRNNITALRYVYEDPDRFKVYILINDNWELVHDMIIE